MSLHIPDLYERFPLYDAQGYQVAWGVRKLVQPGVTVCPGINKTTAFHDVPAHVELMTEARADQL